MTRDPASTAPLDELVRMNVAGDIEAVRGRLDGMARVLRIQSIRDDVDPDRVAGLLTETAEVLARIAAGVRGEGAPTREGGDGAAAPSSPSPPPTT